MQLNFKKCLSDTNVINKEFATGEGSSISKTGTLRDPCSITDPVILVEQSDASLCDFNYLEIPAFSRSYYITSIKTTTASTWEITAHVDVLETYKTDILEAPGIVERREYNPNYLVDQGLIQSDDRTITAVMPFTKIEHEPFHTVSKGGQSVACIDPDAWTYVLIVAGPGPVTPDPEPEP